MVAKIIIVFYFFLTHENNRVDTKTGSLARIQAELCKVYAVKNDGKHGNQDGGYKSCLLDL